MRTTAVKRKWSSIATVTIIVGTAKTPFNVHLDLLCEASSFFKAAFTHDVKEKSEQRMELPEDDVDSFNHLVHWLYTQRCELPGGTASSDEWEQAFQMFILLEKYDIVNLKGLIVRNMFRLLSSRRSNIQMQTVTFAYEHTSQNSGIRKMLSDSMAHKVKSSGYDPIEVQEWLRKHPDIATDLVISFAKKTAGKKDPFSGEMPEEYMDKKPESEE